MLFSCQKDSVFFEKKKSTPLNTFSMQVNGREWEPSQIGDDICRRTYNGAWSALGNTPFFNITAYRDPEAQTSYLAENSLDIQVMNIKGLGKYLLTGSYLGSRESYASFRVNKPNGIYVRYVTTPGKSYFVVEFKAFSPIPGTTLQAVKGVFNGTLYNDKDLRDSVIIDNGTFTFNRPNRYSFDQCD